MEVESVVNGLPGPLRPMQLQLRVCWINRDEKRSAGSLVETLFKVNVADGCWNPSKDLGPPTVHSRCLGSREAKSKPSLVGRESRPLMSS